ncbi:alkaline phosphatase family protein [Alicyclobacillus fastidiosus]|uniref:alkaline phosphatase family protein n=1 Tax=Alicyclobacillus fastidiosus TaxID=392011 RepID=UPI0023E982C3|nr:alkaline phosphatase family protein [Alicyclobacillus fastidiosus]GMA66010.1 phosphoesterase [Alicyclobacillus fastidiosus]
MKKGFKKRNLIVGVTLATVLAGSTSVMAAEHKYYTVGRQQNGSVVLPTDQVITPAGQQAEFPGRPAAVAVSPDGKTAAYNVDGLGYGDTPGYDPIVTVDLTTGKVKQKFTLTTNQHAGSYTGIIYSKDGSHLYVSYSENQIADFNVASDGTLSLNDVITLPGTPVPGALALSPDGKTLYVALSRNNALGVIDLTNHQLVKQIPVGNAPYGVVIDGSKAYVSNEGGRTAKPGDYTNDSSGTPIVSNPKTGAASTGTVSVVDLSTQAVTANMEVGLQPTAMYKSGQYLFVANTNNDTVSVIDTQTQQVIKTITIQPYPNAPFGSQPNAITMMPGNRLVVSLGSNNALAVYDWQGPREAVRFEGLIPTGWFPGGVALDPQYNRLVVANIKGVGSLDSQNFIGPSGPDGRTGYATYDFLGSTSLIPYPSEKNMIQYTAEVVHDNGWDKEKANDATSSHGNVEAQPIPLHIGDPSTIKHVFYIIKENRTYDQQFGDMPQGNGDPSLTIFGQKVTPNQHALAEQFPLFDNFYGSGSISADGHQWTDQALAPDYVEREFGSYFPRSYPSTGGDSLAYLSSGFIWDDAVKHGKTVRNYGEYVSNYNGPQNEFGTWQDWYKDSQILEGKQSGNLHVPIGTFQTSSDIPSNDALLDRDFPPFDLPIPDQYRADIFLKDFQQYVKNKNLPNLMIMSLPDDHTAGTSPGYPTPEAMVADNDLALGRMVDAISHSPYWKDSAIFVVEDDSQNGVDHVDGHRMPALVISPYAKRQTVDHTYYTQVDVVRTIEQILGLPPMNQMDAAATPMRDAFTDKPDFTPYNVVANQIPLNQMNPSPTAIPSTSAGVVQKAWATTAKQMFKGTPQDEDHPNEALLNRDIWYSAKGFNTPYPGDKKVLLPSGPLYSTTDTDN